MNAATPPAIPDQVITNGRECATGEFLKLCACVRRSVFGSGQGRMSCPIIHSPKVEGIERDAERDRALFDAWRLRLALRDIGRFAARDPLPPRARTSAQSYLIRKRADASIFLACLRARRNDEARTQTRGGMRLISGGRS